MARYLMSVLGGKLARRSIRVAFALAPALALAQSAQYRSPAGVSYGSLPDTGVVAPALLRYRQAPTVENAVALGTAQAAVRQFREAVETFSDAIRRHPDSAILLRWRGHRYLTLREFNRAAQDLERAVGLDSALYGAWYHLGIVRFAHGAFREAADAFARGLPNAPNAGELNGSVDWLWMSLARAGASAEAAALLARRPDTIDAGNAYARRLKLYRGEIGPGDVITAADTADVQHSTLAFGVGNWHRIRGDTAAANRYFRRAIEAGGWPGFGFIIAEAELSGRTAWGGLRR